jgi:4-hydroxy-3-polyprenylbenzoate decarboxylase
MSYVTLESALLDLEKEGMLLRIKEEVDPYLEMSAIQLKVYAQKGPALLFENVKGSRYRAVSNIFGTMERCHFLFRDSIDDIKRLIALRKDPVLALKDPIRNIGLGWKALNALPRKSAVSGFEEIAISDLPLIHHWPMDGGAFVTLPQVYTEDPQQPGIRYSNLGMYRIQLNGNEYTKDEEIGLHYQLHRGIGVHHTAAAEMGKPMKVSVFVGGPPSHTVAAVMPLPEGMSELSFAGLLGSRRFRYAYADGYCISQDADFVIMGEVIPGRTMPEGPFGDHLGYYSLQHPFPVMKVHKVLAKKNAIWAFTVVGRPPQEDTGFGNFIHELTGKALQDEIPGLKEVHAVDAAGVHPLLLAIGKERYTPYAPTEKPAEILTIANHILGTGQLSLAKFLFIAADENGQLSTKNIKAYFEFILSRINLSRDIHFHTNTTQDTLDYSGTGLNSGSKVVFAACGKPLRQLCNSVPNYFSGKDQLKNPCLVMPGVVAICGPAFTHQLKAAEDIAAIESCLVDYSADDLPLIIVCDDSQFVSANENNFLWTCFTKSNPSHDIYGVGAFTEFKHWGCKGPLIMDARSKPHHAPAMTMPEEVEKSISRIFEKGGSLHKIIKS